MLIHVVIGNLNFLFFFFFPNFLFGDFNEIVGHVNLFRCYFMRKFMCLALMHLNFISFSLILLIHIVIRNLSIVLFLFFFHFDLLEIQRDGCRFEFLWTLFHTKILFA